MADEMRDGVAARLSQAIERRAALKVKMEALATGIAEVRATLGNPFFYSPRPESDPQSESRFTGYKSHDPGLQLLREWQDVSKEIGVGNTARPRTRHRTAAAMPTAMLLRSTIPTPPTAWGLITIRRY
jgi:hypothetical protein